VQIGCAEVVILALLDVASLLDVVSESEINARLSVRAKRGLQNYRVLVSEIRCTSTEKAMHRLKHIRAGKERESYRFRARLPAQSMEEHLPTFVLRAALPARLLSISS
jgi:hypothetical protein